MAGLIPAHAGKTAIKRSRSAMRAAHPRSRGENSAKNVAVVGFGGSSPLTRGKPALSSSRTMRTGLIPAHAGKTPLAPRPDRRSWAHPRSRGENAFGWAGQTIERGSSPLTRGKRASGAWMLPDVGLIPAHAGKTRSSAGAESGQGAHPRSRGENPLWEFDSFQARGSSPLTRGKLLRRDYRRVLHGLIPAHAGKTNDHAAA